MVYVTHCYKNNLNNAALAIAKTKELQLKDTETLYVCPLNTFSHLNRCSDFETKKKLRIDLLSCCDKLIVIGDTDEFVDAEIEEAEKWGINIEYVRE